MKNFKAFTLTELIVVVILIGIIAAFALPNYQKTILKAHERDAIVQLMAIHAACKIYEAQVNGYPAGILGLPEINNTFGLNVIANGMTYQYSSSRDDEFQVTAADFGDNFTIRVNEEPIDPGTNPCCLRRGECPSLQDCPGLFP